jgi:hypothetical protein
VIDNTLREEEACLAVWGMEMIKNRELTKIVDQRISGTIKQHSLDLFSKTLERCLAAEKRARPSMEDVLGPRVGSEFGSQQTLDTMCR